MAEKIEVNPEQYDNTCYIVGGGSSLRGFDWSLLDGKYVIAVNRSYEVLPNAQILYFTDEDYYARHRDAMMRHSGVKVKGSLNPALCNAPGVIQYHLISDTGLVVVPGCLAHGSNSTYAAINLAAVHLGFKKIYIMGIDMKWGIKHDRSTTHWHDGHPRVDPEPAYQMMMAKYATIVGPLQQRGIEVVNVNNPEDTDLKVFPIQTYEQVFGRKYPIDED